MMKYAMIKKTDIANGTGVRVSLFVSGCTHHCKGCFNEEAWDFDYGKEYTPETQQEILNAMAFEYISGLSLLGGEPFEPENQYALLGLVKAAKEKFPDKTIWCYTGYTFERDLLSESRAKCSVTDELLSYIDILVDGEFEIEKKNISLKFRGSENQRIILVKESLEKGITVLSELNN